jgi:uncharacterized damage-inducible protein DinB
MENRNFSVNEIVTSREIVSLEGLMKHWQGHRLLTRKLIELYPEDQFYSFSIGGMRTCADLVMEIIGLTAPGIHGIVTGVWISPNDPDLSYSTPAPATKQEVLDLWDRITSQMTETWKGMTQERALEIDSAFGFYEDTIINSIFYLIDNEIHHRGQAYVYMRSLGHEPPGFWDRA